MQHSIWETGQRLGAVPYRLIAADESTWYDIPGVRVVGAILGTVLLVAALRSMFGRGGR
ncbi:hypothetical protein [Plantactinospora sonchi]|uniref:Uncharacterized protein n=1 Tax=Plantactinospora sonchi TaxID=1544735 RepID=A0ABU7RZP6_9ACTN